MSTAAEQEQWRQDNRVAQLEGTACLPGPLVKRAGVRGDGKVWAGIFCPLDLCPVDWQDARAIVLPSLNAWQNGAYTGE